MVATIIVNYHVSNTCISTVFPTNNEINLNTCTHTHTPILRVKSGINQLIRTMYKIQRLPTW